MAPVKVGNIRGPAGAPAPEPIMPMHGFTRSGGGVSIQDEGVGIGGATTLDFAGAGVTAAIVGGKAVVTIPGGGGGLSIVGPYHVAWDTPDFMAPASDWGPVLFTVPAGSIFQAWAFLTEAFDQPGLVQLGFTSDPSGFSHFLPLATYYGVATPQADTGAMTESKYIVGGGTANDLDPSIPRWAYTPDDRSLVASYQPDGANATAGAADIYALIIAT